MNTLYLDIFSGLSGDMFVGALIDLGADPARIEAALRSLPLEGYHLHCRRTRKAQIAGVKFDVHVDASGAVGHHHDHGHDRDHESSGHAHVHPHHPEPAHADNTHHRPSHPHHAAAGGARTLRQIRDLIGQSGLPDWVKEKAAAVFARLADAEGRIHGLPPEDVHFHEVGAVDSIVDIVGACVALDLLGRPRVLAGPVVDGTGWVRCDHGRFPLPAPATLAILGARGVAVTQCDEPHELVTPTGAALLAEFAESFAPMRDLVASRIGYGLGSRDLATRPNVVRAILGEQRPARTAHDWETDTVAVLETNLDDIRAEWLGDFVPRALAAGALDAFHTPIQMKKGRPGVLLTLLAPAELAEPLAALVLRETTAFGVRLTQAERRKLRRTSVTVATPYGPIPVKLGRLDGRLVQAAPEYEDCRAAAERTGATLKAVYEAALRAAPEV